MSDAEEDWENACDDLIEDKKEDKKEEGKFVDEDAVDSDEEREKAKVAAAEKLKTDAAKPKAPKKGKKDYEALYAERIGKGAQKAAALAGQKGVGVEAISRAAEEDITDQLFSQELEMKSSGLRSEQNYVKFAQQVGDVLYEGQTPYNIPAFFTELSRGLSNVELSSVEIKKIVDSFTVMFNARVAEEKKRDGAGKKGGKQKPKLAGGKAIDNTRNNNPAMVADLMGDDDEDYGNEYGDYGDESVPSASKIATASKIVRPDFDFM